MCSVEGSSETGTTTRVEVKAVRRRDTTPQCVCVSCELVVLSELPLPSACVCLLFVTNVLRRTVVLKRGKESDDVARYSLRKW